MASEEAAVEAGVSQAVGTRWFREAGKGASVSALSPLMSANFFMRRTKYGRAARDRLRAGETGGAVGQRLPIVSLDHGVVRRYPAHDVSELLADGGQNVRP